VITANCLCEHSDRSFDLNTFVETTHHSSIFQTWLRLRYTRYGLFQPPAHAGRKYLDELREQSLVEVDGIGGTVLLIRADLHRDGLNFPAFPFHGLIETEGLADMARAMGSSCWGMPNTIVRHVEA
jgi:hypothetical protein